LGRAFFGCFAAASIGALLTSGAAAQSAGEDVLARGIDPVVNKLSPSIGSFLTLAGARLGPERTYQLDFWVDYNYGLLAYQIGDEKLGDLIRHRLDLHLMGAIAVTDWLELALDVPVTAWQAHGFDELEAETGFVAAAPSSAGLGDVRLLARAGLLRDPEGPLLAAAILEARGLSGAGDSFLGERQVVIFPRLALEREVLSILRLTAEVGYRYRTQPGQYLNIYVGDEWAGGLGAQLALPGSTPLQNALLAELLVSTPARAAFTFSSADSLKTPMEALIGFRSRLADEWHLALGAGRGLAVTPGYGRTALRAFASIRYEGKLSEPPVDGDRDQDGLMDSQDRCPDEPGLPELDGCPDRDNDAIPDIQDRCPDDKGVPKLDGCPPKEAVAVYEDGGLILFGTISFDSGKATLKSESFEVVDTVAELLTAHPEIARIRVDGHTDDVGKAETNLDLSDRRAAAVVDYLVNKGVARGRLDSKGFGESEPVDSNATALGRAKNRRVAFTVLETGEPLPSQMATPPKPTSAPVPPKPAAPAPQAKPLSPSK
jgi:OmpA-OmpF porin, OOP family